MKIISTLILIALIAMILSIGYWGAEICENIRYRPVVIKLDKVYYDVETSDGTQIYIIERGEK